MAGRLIAAGTAAILAVGAVRQLRRMAKVSPPLRSPLLTVPLVVNGLTLPIARRLMQTSITPPDGVRVSTMHVPRGASGVATRLLTFEREGSTGRRPVLFWTHGGGYVMGTPEQDMAFIARLLACFDMIVVSVDYRLAPEHPFPAPLDDCHAALTWVVEQADDLQIDPSRLVIGGQSAGGGLAAALVQRVMDQGPIVPIFQLLIYPMLDAATVDRVDNGGTGELVWTPESNRFGWKSYLGTADPCAGRFPAYAVPSAHTRLAGLPPAWIGMGSLDLFFAEDLEYARRLREAGVACEVHVTEGAYHGFDVLMPDTAPAKEFTASMLAALRKVFDEPPRL